MTIKKRLLNISFNLPLQRPSKILKEHLHIETTDNPNKEFKGLYKRGKV